MSHPLTPEQQTALTTLFGFAPDRPTIIIGATIPPSGPTEYKSWQIDGDCLSYTQMLAMILNMIDDTLIRYAGNCGITPSEINTIVDSFRRKIATRDQTFRHTTHPRSGDRA